MKQRIQLHKKSRPQSWQTIEEPANLSKILVKIEHKILIFDCINFWLANVIAEHTESHVLFLIDMFFKKLKQTNIDTCYFVTNETGLSLVSEYKSGRQFQNLLGKINQLIAGKHAAEVFFMISGIPLKIK
jgi:adenosylcobinamide kinase/adenosylcobinamide-phosphate guanylyltransferase